jgi:Uncharacterized protein conserved in bacteria
MGIVTLNVNGRRYDVSCDDGEEERLRGLGTALDRRVRKLVASLGQVGEARLLLLTCLLLEDEVTEVRASVASGGPVDGHGEPAQTAETLAPELDALAGRIEAVAGRLKPS